MRLSGFSVFKPLMFFVQRQDYIDVATGSLGQGLSVAAGMAYCGKYYDKARSAADSSLFCLADVNSVVVHSIGTFHW